MISGPPEFTNFSNMSHTSTSQVKPKKTHTRNSKQETYAKHQNSLCNKLPHLSPKTKHHNMTFNKHEKNKEKSILNTTHYHHQHGSRNYNTHIGIYFRRFPGTRIYAKLSNSLPKCHIRTFIEILHSQNTSSSQFASSTAHIPGIQ